MIMARIGGGIPPREIPYPYVIDGSASDADRSMSAATRHFPTTELAQIGDETAYLVCSTPRILSVIKISTRVVLTSSLPGYGTM